MVSRIHLRDVRRGAKILVSDRDTVIAELRRPASGHSVPRVQDSIVNGWIRDGVVGPPSAKKAPLPESPIRLNDGTARHLLQQSRNETRD